MENSNEEVVRMNEWQRIIGIFTSPSVVFSNVRKRPTVRAGLIILCVVTAAAMVYPLAEIILPAEAASTREAFLEEGRSAEEVEMMMRYAAGPFALVAGILASLLTPLVSVLFRSGVHSLFLLMSGVMSNFKQVMAINTRVYYVALLGMLIKIPIWISTGDMRADLGLAAFLSEDVEMTSRLYRLFANLEVFVIWQVVLTGIGLSCVLGMSSKKGALMSVLAWLFMVAISLAIPESCAQRF
jgi:hypothetical protein